MEIARMQLIANKLIRFALALNREVTTPNLPSQFATRFGWKLQLATDHRLVTTNRQLHGGHG